MQNFAKTNFEYLASIHPGGKGKFANLLGIPANYISKYSKGTLNIGVELIALICKNLNYSSDDFLFTDLRNSGSTKRDSTSIVSEPSAKYGETLLRIDSSGIEQVIREIKQELAELKKQVAISKELV